jgi:hypothetical protein
MLVLVVVPWLMQDILGWKNPLASEATGRSGILQLHQ